MSNSSAIPAQVGYPLAAAFLWMAFLHLLKINQTFNFLSIHAGFLTLMGFYLAQGVAIAWGCKKIPKDQIFYAVGAAAAVAFVFHLLSEKTPPLIYLGDFLVLEVLCVAFGIHWRKKYYSQQIKHYHNDFLSNLIARAIDFGISVIKKIKDKQKTKARR